MNCVISWRRQQQDSSTSCPIREPSPLKALAALIEWMSRGTACRILVPRMLFFYPFSSWYVTESNGRVSGVSTPSERLAGEEPRP